MAPKPTVLEALQSLQPSWAQSIFPHRTSRKEVFLDSLDLASPLRLGTIVSPSAKGAGVGGCREVDSQMLAGPWFSRSF